MLIFRATKEQLLQDLMTWAGCQNNPIYLNFHLQKSFEIFEKNSAENIDPTKTFAFVRAENALSRARQD